MRQQKPLSPPPARVEIAKSDQVPPKSISDIHHRENRKTHTQRAEPGNSKKMTQTEAQVICPARRRRLGCALSWAGDSPPGSSFVQSNIILLQEYQQDDRLSNLPDDILVLILSKLELMQDAVRTSILSRRWRHLLGFCSEIVLDVLDFINTKGGDAPSDYTIDELVQTNVSVVEATKSILQQNCLHTIKLLSITFYLRDESIDIVRYVDKTMANKKVLEAEFTIIPEELDTDDNYMLAYGRRFMAFFGAYPRAFGGLTDLSLHSLRLGESDIPSVFSTCKKLEYLSLENCDAGIRSILQVEHSQLVELSISSCNFERVELKWLPKLTYFSCQDWLPSQDQYPMSFGHVPQLRTLTLINACSTLNKSFKLSEFLSNVIIGELDLDFQCKRVSDR